MLYAIVNLIYKYISSFDKVSTDKLFLTFLCNVHLSNSDYMCLQMALKTVGLVAILSLAVMPWLANART